MASVSTQVRINETAKKHDDIQEEKYPKFRPEVMEAMEEARQISRDPNVKRYSSFSEALEDMDL